MLRTLTQQEYNAIRDEVINRAPAGLSEEEFTRYIGPEMEKAIGIAENTTAPLQGSALKRAMSGLWSTVNPVNMATGLYRAVRHPVDTASGIIQAHGDQIGKARESFQQGRYSEALGHGVASVVPFVGPVAANIGEQIAETGDVATGVGAGAGLIAPAVLTRPIVGAVKSSFRRSPNPALQDAVAFGQREGIPLDAATATGNRFIQSAQKRVSDSFGGAGVAEDFQAQQAQALTQTGQRLAGRVSRQPVAPETAGQEIRDAITGKIRKANEVQGRAYSKVEAAEANPANVRTVQTGTQRVADPSLTSVATQAVTEKMPLPVDVRQAKAALKPIRDRLKNLYPVAKRDASAGYQALSNIVDGPDFQPLSVVDDNLGAIKAIVREADMPEMRTVSQGLAAKSVEQLDQAVRSTARQAGVMPALKAGRKATVYKYAAGDVLDGIRQEPVRAFQQATLANDAGVAKLREIARFAPGELPKVGRAYLDDLIGKATAEGGFDRAAGLMASWQKLGPQTKAMLFQDRALIKDLDRFFLLAKKIGENPNPSGTARVATAFNVASGTLGYPLAKLFYTPQGVKLLTRGLQIPAANQRATSAWLTEVASMAGVAGQSMHQLGSRGTTEAGAMR